MRAEDMRRVLIISVLVLSMALVDVSADGISPLQVEVEDQFNSTLGGCDIEIRDAWSQALIIAAISSDDGPSSFDIERGRTYSIAAQCADYAVDWQMPITIPSSGSSTVVINTHQSIDNLFSLSGIGEVKITANGTLWSSIVEINGSTSVRAPSGLDLIVSGDGGHVYRTTESIMAIANESTVFNLTIPPEWDESNGLRLVHSASGEVIEVGESLNFTVGTEGGGWSARMTKNSIGVGQSTWPPTDSWLEEQIGSDIDNGSAILEIVSGMAANDQTIALWQANHSFDISVGIPLVPGMAAGIESQVERWFAGDVSGLEDLIEVMSYSDSINSLCCTWDLQPFSSDNLIIESNINFDSGYWGWNESADLSGQRRHISLIRLGVVMADDIRQQTPLRIIIPEGWQHLSSSALEWFNGSPENFVIQRDQASIAGEITITIGQNQAPIVSVPSAVLAHEVNHEFIAQISDSPLSSHDCSWNISGLESNISVNLSQFPADTNLSVELSCSDDGGLIGQWQGEFLLDDEAPVIHENSDLIFHSPNSVFEWMLNASDDHDENLEVTWTSNKTLNWTYSGQFLSTSFFVDSSLNSATDTIEQRHLQRQPVQYSLGVEVMDDAGHISNANWVVELIDSSAPILIPVLEAKINDTWIEADQFTFGEEIRMNLNQSFDDYNAITELNFVLFSEEFGRYSLSWDEINDYAFPLLSPGVHRFVVLVSDNSGNLASKYIDIPVNPRNGSQLGISMISSNTDIEVGINRLHITVENGLGSPAIFMVCQAERCVQSAITGATFAGPATSEVILDVELGWWESVELKLSWSDDSGNEATIYHPTKISSGSGIGALEMVTAIIALAVGIWFIRQRKKPLF
jgi:hypothetical protein